MVLFQDPDEIVRIKIRRKTRDKLKQCGIKGETYEEIIQRLIKRWNDTESLQERAVIKIRDLGRFSDGELVGEKAK